MNYFASMCYAVDMDTTIRNLDQQAYREIKARAALTGRTVGELINEAIRAYLARPAPTARVGSLRDLSPEPYPGPARARGRVPCRHRPAPIP